MGQLLRQYQIPLIIASIAILLAAFNQQLHEVLSYQRSLISDGELWRLVTGNFLHSNWPHLLLNIGGLFLIWFVYNDLGDPLWQWIFLLTPLLGCTLLLFAFSPDLEGYVGLSGGLHGTIVAFGLADFRKNKLLSVLLVIGVTMKLGYEQVYGSSESIKELIQSNVAIDAHLWGAICGFAVGIIYLFYTNQNRSEEFANRD
ncbi:rhombosortase [Pleionea sediminis]|uniref:rhombosortase n=1 Tax=Pleionea sediminis TaxID=2569479 RepID=UPI001186C7D2|nr:rhombosortase [Pleionea sediminis]